MKWIVGYKCRTISGEGDVNMTQLFSGLKRDEVIDEMEDCLYDVLIIGGGITGAGIALDAVTRGLKVALIEMQDFAAGTSSRSTKLIHGGLRYLKQFEFKMVSEVGKERAIVYENGPHVTTPEWMLLPIYKGGTFGRLSTNIGLRVYDFLAGIRRSERRRMLQQRETLGKEPLLREEGLQGGGYYVEYRTDDARLTIEVIKKAVDHGATAVNYVKADEFIYTDGILSGAHVRDEITGRSFVIRAKKVVNATGPWVDQLREMDHSRTGKTLRLTKGIHLVFSGERFPLRQAIYFDTPDGRMMFAIPRDGKTYVGTSDTDYTGDLLHPKMTEQDRDYVLQATKSMFPSLDLTVNDIESSWAGLRPLIAEEGKSPSEVSRKDEVFHSESGLITIAGGKLTGYRRMAERVTDVLVEELTKDGLALYSPCTTKILMISGGDVGGSAKYPLFLENAIEEGIALGLAPAEAEQLARRYGSNVAIIHKLLPDLEMMSQQVGMPTGMLASLIYGIEHEMVVKPTDFLIRRTGALWFDVDVVHKWSEQIVKVMTSYLHYSETLIQEYTAEIEQHLLDTVNPSSE